MKFIFFLFYFKFPFFLLTIENFFALQNHSRNGKFLTNYSFCFERCHTVVINKMIVLNIIMWIWWSTVFVFKFICFSFIHPFNFPKNLNDHNEMNKEKRKKCVTMNISTMKVLLFHFPDSLTACIFYNPGWCKCW